MEHIGEVMFGHFDGKGFDLACPQRYDAISHRCQREAPNPIEQASHGQHSVSFYFVTIAVMLRVVLTANCAV